MNNIRSRIIALIVLVLISGVALLSVEQGSDWVYTREVDQIRVYTRQNPSSQIVEFKGVSRDKAKIEDVASILLDLPSYTKWIKYISKSYIVRKVDDNNLIVYQRFLFFFPYQDRDIVVAVKISRDYKSGILRADFNATNDSSVPPTNDCVRIKKLHGEAEIRYQNRELTEGSFTERFDPGGNVPDWLTDALCKQMPIVVLTKLKEELNRGHAAGSTEKDLIKKEIEKSIRSGLLKE
jgi:hypothetical protein